MQNFCWWMHSVYCVYSGFLLARGCIPQNQLFLQNLVIKFKYLNLSNTIFRRLLVQNARFQSNHSISQPVDKIFLMNVSYTKRVKWQDRRLCASLMWAAKVRTQNFMFVTNKPNIHIIIQSLNQSINQIQCDICTMQKKSQQSGWWVEVRDADVDDKHLRLLSWVSLEVFDEEIPAAERPCLTAVLESINVRGST